MRSVANSGLATRFWEDRWLDGSRIQDVAPLLYSRVPKHIRDSRLVAPAVENGSWALDVGPDIGPAVFCTSSLWWSGRGRPPDSSPSNLPMRLAFGVEKEDCLGEDLRGLGQTGLDSHSTGQVGGMGCGQNKKKKASGGRMSKGILTSESCPTGGRSETMAESCSVRVLEFGPFAGGVGFPLRGEVREGLGDALKLFGVISIFHLVLMDDKTEKGKEKDGSASTPPNRRKAGLKFSPKVPTKKTPKIVPKMRSACAKKVMVGFYREPEEERELDTIDKELLMKLRIPQSQGALERRSKAEKSEACVQVAFGQVNSSTARSFPNPKSSSSVKQEQEVNLFSKYMMSGVTSSAAKLPKQFTGPQDFTHHSYNYPPITLPLRRPHSADPGYGVVHFCSFWLFATSCSQFAFQKRFNRHSSIFGTEDFDKDAFGEFSSSRTQDGELTAAKELGLMDTEDKMNTPQLLFFQFPASLPLPQVVSVAGGDMDTSDSEGVETEETNKKRRLESINGCKLKDLPGGLMGKLLVYKSGKVKMRLGDALFDVSAGLDCTFAQEAVAINTNKKHCCSLGEVNKRAILTPDIEYLVDSIKRIG
ncbi:uncharacterized protein [Triticum aestivum]|uniref:uncharacterized protein n=1 Tax=Triticum aestivum TaxID=4565 RepID=UPI001D015F20|nr:uncharacterized protein LOC123086902 [Triticum aestivum]